MLFLPCNYVSASPLVNALKAIAIRASSDPSGEWAEKYGTDFENDVFMMHRYCWCEEDQCGWCNGDNPNFIYKPFNFKVKWYKYIGRSMKSNMTFPPDKIALILENCIGSL